MYEKCCPYLIIFFLKQKAGGDLCLPLASAIYIQNAKVNGRNLYYFSYFLFSL